MSKIPHLQSPHDDEALNIHNRVIDTVNNVWGITDNIENINDEALRLLRDVQSRLITKPTFKIGGVTVDKGEQTNTPRTLVSENIIPFNKGDVIQPYANDDYNYSLMLFKNGEFAGGWGLGYYSFNRIYTVPENYEAYIVISRVKTGADMTQEDVNAAERAFLIKRNESSFGQSVGLNFELGGYSDNGNKVTGTSPYQIRSTEIFNVTPGMKIETKYADYKYIVLLLKDGESLGFQDWRDFGESYTFDDNYQVAISIERFDRATMTQQDLTNVNNAFSNVELDLIALIQGMIDNSTVSNKVEFELGTVRVVEGIKSPSTITLVSKDRVRLNAGDVIAPVENSQYEYSLMLFKNGSYQGGWGLGYYPFSKTYRVPEDCEAYIVINQSTSSPVTLTQADIEEVESDFMINRGENDGVVEEDDIDKFNIIGTLDGYMTDNITGHFNNPETLSITDYYSTFRALKNQYSTMLTEHHLGKDAYDYDQYWYHFKPYAAIDSPLWNLRPDEDEGRRLDIPKFILTAGIHGNERIGSYVLYHFAKILLENPDNNPIIDTIAQNIEFIMIPTCTPSGFVDKTYNSRSDINMNRDFPPHGNTTLPETRYVKSVIDAHSDADYHIDLHQYVANSGHRGILGYALTDVEELKIITQNAYKYIGREWQKKDSRYPQERYRQWGYVGPSNPGTVGRYTTDVLGIPGSIVEIPLDNANVTEPRYGENHTQLFIDLLVNIITGLIIGRR